MVGRVWENDFQPSRVEPSLSDVPPTATLSIQTPGGIVPDSPSVAGSLNVRNASNTVWPAYAERLHVSCFQAPEKPVKPGTFATAVGNASGLCSDVVSVQATLWYVRPSSVETWTKPKSQPSSSFQSASKVTAAPEPVGTATCLTIASSRSSAAPE